MVRVRSARNSERALPEIRVCHLCYQRGHLAWNCPARRALLTLVRLLPGLHIPLNTDLRYGHSSRVNARVVRYHEEVRERAQYQSYRSQSGSRIPHYGVGPLACQNSPPAGLMDCSSLYKVVFLALWIENLDVGVILNENSTERQSSSTFGHETQSPSPVNASETSLTCNMSTTATFENYVQERSFTEPGHTDRHQDTTNAPDMIDSMELGMELCLDSDLNAEDYCGNEFSIL
ncbi:hypothetical protein FE257_007816 [Aspergillus nanangensis]|uniref:CCHC-type domain-containing protein n=1 Tax=Aspergillus nanangensis TaxID=2582783 RepID=A0AAD4H040_ASPNN|nr:hypothetical protein FE257_007816 [Aspergillus nanangensis]